MLIGWEVISPTWGGPSRSGLLPNYRYGRDRFRGGAISRTSAYVGLAGRLRRWLQFQFAPRSRSLPSRSDGRYFCYLQPVAMQMSALGLKRTNRPWPKSDFVRSGPRADKRRHGRFVC